MASVLTSLGRINVAVINESVNGQRLELKTSIVREEVLNVHLQKFTNAQPAKIKDLQPHHTWPDTSQMFIIKMVLNMMPMGTPRRGQLIAGIDLKQYSNSRILQ